MQDALEDNEIAIFKCQKLISVYFNAAINLPVFCQCFVADRMMPHIRAKFELEITN